MVVAAGEEVLQRLRRAAEDYMLDAQNYCAGRGDMVQLAVDLATQGANVEALIEEADAAGFGYDFIVLDASDLLLGVRKTIHGGV